MANTWSKRQGIMLCQPLDDTNLFIKNKNTLTMLTQPKLDGQRAWVSWTEDGEPILVSSQGNPITGVPHINFAIKRMSLLTGCSKIEWDGELYTHHMKFEEIISRTKRMPENIHPDFLAVQYHIFDYKGFNTPQRERLQKVAQTIASFKKKDEIYWDTIEAVRTVEVPKTEIENMLNIFVKAGYEGIILRNPNALYVESRPATILKWKPSKQDFYRIIGVYEAFSFEGEPLGYVGALECEDRYGNRFKVGGGLGLSLDERAQMWADRKELLKKWACVKYQNLTKQGMPRFGKFTAIVVEPTTENREEESWI